jgi:hypothetical protein
MKKIEKIVRTVGEKKPGQCIWGFINGILNTKESARASAALISKATGGEAVYSLRNDTAFFGIKDLVETAFLKLSVDTPLVQGAARFFRYLLTLSEQEIKPTPVVVFAHSQGAIISERVLGLLKETEKEKIRVFTLGGGSFIPPGHYHPDSHNYASAADPVCRVGSPDLQLLALALHEGKKQGLTQDLVFHGLAMQDAMLDIDSRKPLVLQKYVQGRIDHYKKELARMSNITILDPDPGKLLKHRFSSKCYQDVVRSIILKYQSQQR